MSAPASSLTGRFTAPAVMALTVLVFGAAVVFVTERLRTDLHQQILRRHADTLTDLAAWQLDDAAQSAVALGIPEVPGEIFAAVLKTSKFRDVLALRLFDAQRQFVTAAGPILTEDPPSEAEWALLVHGESVARLHPRETVAELVGAGTTPRRGEKSVPVFEAWVPLRRSAANAFAGAAQFWINGEALNAELATVDRRLITQALLAWLAGSLIIVMILYWALRRLAAANRQLRARGEDLQRANRELILAAKTSALGAVTAHLIHEMKNPLAGLEVIVAGQGDGGTGTGAELAAASELTRRLRTMINDVIGVLRDEQGGADFELTAADMAALVLEKTRPEASRRGIELTATGSEEAKVSGRRGNLAVLVLRNLVQNALEATPGGRAVRVHGTAGAGGAVEFLVEDEGGGLPESIKARLFQPCASTKLGGSGLGLALSHQLAQQAGGRLELVRTGPDGTSFRLVLSPET